MAMNTIYIAHAPARRPHDLTPQNTTKTMQTRSVLRAALVALIIAPFPHLKGISWLLGSMYAQPTNGDYHLAMSPPGMMIQVTEQ